jgi:hypothetical protein
VANEGLHHQGMELQQLNDLQQHEVVDSCSFPCPALLLLPALETCLYAAVAPGPSCHTDLHRSMTLIYYEWVAPCSATPFFLRRTREQANTCVVAFCCKKR